MTVALLLGPVLRHVGETDATVWVETSESCTVEILGRRERTWTVAGHHYALILIEGLQPGSTTPYRVHLDDALVWPMPVDGPPSVIRTQRAGASFEVVFGSCRFATQTATVLDDNYEADALDAYARRMAKQSPDDWPDALVLLGDQVYADELSPQTAARVADRHDVSKEPGEQVRNYEEYTWLYAESWSDPEVRWLLSTLPTSMIFDDHDVRDDWNTSESWRDEMEATSWWEERIVGALSSYWVYQHLGNLSPAGLADNELYRRVRECDGDAEPLLRRFASQADEEADGAKGTQWSYRRDFGPVRLLVVDSRCGRVLADGRRAMVSDAEFEWIERQTDGTYDHLLVGTSLPWLLPRALHDLEAWNEQLASGVRGPRLARFAEKIRRGADLEHWAAFHESFDRLAAMFAEVGRRPTAPATICVLSGDVHHAYAAQAHYPGDLRSRVYQLTCSPLHNFVPPAMRVAFRVFWNRFVEKVSRTLLRPVATMPPVPLEWSRLTGPFFGDQVATLRLDGRAARVTFEQASKDAAGVPRLQGISSLDL